MKKGGKNEEMKRKDAAKGNLVYKTRINRIKDDWEQENTDIRERLSFFVGRYGTRIVSGIRFFIIYSSSGATSSSYSPSSSALKKKEKYC
jgi:hypothetical protein